MALHLWYGCTFLHVRLLVDVMRFNLGRNLQVSQNRMEELQSELVPLFLDQGVRNPVFKHPFKVKHRRYVEWSDCIKLYDQFQLLENTDDHNQ